LSVISLLIGGAATLDDPRARRRGPDVATDAIHGESAVIADRNPRKREGCQMGKRVPVSPAGNRSDDPALTVPKSVFRSSLPEAEQPTHVIIRSIVACARASTAPPCATRPVTQELGATPNNAVGRSIASR
jgi:hypothetical protein